MPERNTKQEDHLSLLKTHLPGVFFAGTYDDRYIIHSISANVEELMGYSIQELLDSGISLPDLVHPDDRELLQTNHRLQYERGEQFVNEFRVVTKQGEIKWLLEITSWKKDEIGTVQIEGYVQDFSPFKTGISIANAFKSYQDAVNSGSIVSISDKSGRIIFANDLFSKVSKINKKELVGKNHNIVNSGYHPPEFFKKMWDTILKGEIWRGQIRNRAKDGTLYWVDTIISPVFDNKGNIEQFLSIRNVITEQKEAEDNLKKSEARLEEAQRIAGLGNWELDINSNNIFWSDELYRIFEIEKNTPVTYELFLERIHPDDRDMVDKTYRNSLQNRQPYSIEHRLMLPGGRIKYVQEQCEHRYDKDGTPIRSLGTTQDITKLKESEILLENQRIRYENVVENISDGLIIDDIEGHVVYANNQFKKMIGITDADLANFNFDDYVSEEFKEIVRKRHHSRMRGEDVLSEFEYVGIRKDGVRRWFEVRVSKIEKDGKIIGTQSAIRDITELKENFNKLSASEKEKTELIQELNKRYNELMQFNYIVSHNLRAPIANIMGLTELYGMPETEREEKDQIVGLIHSSIGKIDELISDLNIILAARSDINSKKERIIFHEIISLIEKTLDKQIHDTEAKLEVEIAPDANEIFSIKSYIKSCLYNLVNNALKYRSHKRKPLIRISIKREDGHISIAVRDNGIGIDLSRYGKDIFGLYKRFHTGFEGKGLGLNMTKTQVESLGGTIRIDSVPDEGTEFTILLPDVTPVNGNHTIP